MTKIDTERFIVSMIQQLKDGHPLRVNILYALLNQGLIYTGDSIVRVVNKKEGPSLEEAITNEPAIKRRPDPLSTTSAEWSEDDETHIHSIISSIELLRKGHMNAPVIVESYDSDLKWLKSFKHRSRWKPSEEQMKALKICCNGWVDNADGTLESLYNDLIKLT